MSVSTEDSVHRWPEDLDIRIYADSSMTLPGMGESGDGCGEYYPAEFCNECGELHFSQKRCYQRKCPNDWTGWVKRRSVSATHRLGCAREMADEGLEMRAVHAMVSAKEGSVRSLQDVRDGYHRANELVQEAGVRGASGIFHGFRVLSDVKDVYEAAVHYGRWDPEEDGKLWQWVREHDRHWRDLTYWSPHWHFIGLSAEFRADDPDDQDGWVVRRLRTLENWGLEHEDGYKDMLGTFWYLLSHSAYEAGTSTDIVRHYGSLSNYHFSKDDCDESAKILETTEAIADRDEDEDDQDLELEDLCCDNCGALDSLAPIWRAGERLQDKGWCQRIGRGQQKKLQAAFEWQIGERKPPPGLQRPTSEAEAKESLESLV